MELIQMMQNRRSVRKYTGEPVGEEALKKVVQAGLLSESGKWQTAEQEEQKCWTERIAR